MTKTKKRTDIHRPSAPEFDPQAYELFGVYDLVWGQGHDPVNHREEVSLKDDLEALRKVHSQGPGVATKQCGHCGAHLTYAAILTHVNGDFIFVGHDCLENRFKSLTAEEFKKLREAARLNRERASRQDRIDALAKSESVARLLREGADGDYFLTSLLTQIQSHGHLSERQLAALDRAWAGKDRRAAWKAQKAAETAELAKRGVKAPEGRVTVEGTVVSIKVHQGLHGEVAKFVVKTDEGWACWATVPAVLDTPELARGVKVRFVTTLTRSDRDPLFAFGKRPTKGEFVTA